MAQNHHVLIISRGFSHVFFTQKVVKNVAPHRRGGVDGTRCPRVWPPALSLERMGKTWGKPGKNPGKLVKDVKNGVVLLGKNMKTSNIYGGLLGKSSRIGGVLMGLSSIGGRAGKIIKRNENMEIIVGKTRCFSSCGTFHGTMMEEYGRME